MSEPEKMDKKELREIIEKTLEAICADKAESITYDLKKIGMENLDDYESTWPMLSFETKDNMTTIIKK